MVIDNKAEAPNKSADTNDHHSESELLGMYNNHISNQKNNRPWLISYFNRLTIAVFTLFSLSFFNGDWLFPFFGALNLCAVVVCRQLLKIGRPIGPIITVYSYGNLFLLTGTAFVLKGELQVVLYAWFLLLIIFVFLVRGKIHGTRFFSVSIFAVVFIGLNRFYPLPYFGYLEIVSWMQKVYLLSVFPISFLLIYSLIDGFNQNRESATKLIETANKALLTEIAEKQKIVESLQITSTKLSNSEQIFSLAIDSTDDGIWDYVPSSNTVKVTKQYLKLLGEPTDNEFITIDFWISRLHPDEKDTVLARLQQNLDPNSLVGSECEHRLRHRNGHYIWTFNKSRLALNPDGSVARMVGVMSDISDRKLSEFKLLEYQRGLLEAQQQANMGSIDIDLSNQRIYLSPQSFKILNLPEKRTLELDELLLWVHPEDANYTKRTLKNAITNNLVLHYDFRLLLPNDKSIRYIQLAITPLDKANGFNERLVGSIADVTSAHNQVAVMREAKDKAEAATLAKMQFLSTMSHEIRTPMNAVIGFTQLLLLENPTKAQEETLKTLDYSANHLLLLINDILDYTKIDAGKMDFEQRAFMPDILLANLSRMYLPKATEKGLNFNIDAQDLQSIVIIGDEVRLNQILTNLIGNAIKFTEKGSVTISLTKEAEKNGTIWLRFSVIDTGIGIEPHLQSVIFDSFTQARSDTTRKYGGTGLGLAICKRLIELQDGTLSLTSESSNGSNFSFILPFRKASAIKDDVAQNALVSETSKALNLDYGKVSGARILLVEDNMVNVMVATRFLTHWGATVQVAGNGKEAIEMVALDIPDLILMDLQMPVMGGFEATTIIRDMGGAYKTIPIIALTAAASQNVKAEVMSAGMDAYVTKPFHAESLLNNINGLLKGTEVL